MLLIGTIEDFFEGGLHRSGSEIKKGGDLCPAFSRLPEISNQGTGAV
jgi:hypothetical protein